VKNNILLCIDSLNSGGAQKQMVLLANKLAKTNNVTLMYYFDYNFFKKKLNKNINIIYTRGKLRFIFNLIYMIYSQKIEVIYSYLNSVNILVGGIGFLIGYKKIILSERGEHFLNSKLRKLLMRIIARRICYISANSIYLTNRIKNELKIENVRYVPNIIKMSKNCSQKSMDNIINIGLIGRFEKEKNQIFPLQQFIGLRNIIHNKIIFHFAGRNDTNYFKETIYPFVKYNNIERYCKFYGQIREIDDFIKKMDFIVLPSLRESFSNVIIESYNQCRPVLCSNVGDNKYIIDNEIYGFIYENKIQFEKYFIQLCEMNQKERFRIGKVGKEKIKEKFENIGIKENIRLLNSVSRKYSER